MIKRQAVKKEKKCSTLTIFGIFVFLLFIMFFVFIIGININSQFEVYQVGNDESELLTVKCFNIDVSKLLKIDGEVDTTKIGKYNVDYKLLFFKVYQKRIDVVDTLAPKITLKGDKQIFLYNVNDYEEPGYTAVDSYDGNLTTEVKRKISKVNENEYTVEYTVTDYSGNKAVRSRTISLINGGGRVYLTFDDGPSTNVTPQILDILDEKNVKATFFVLGYEPDSQAEEILKREYKSGHTIGLHGKSHEYSEIYSSIDSIMNNFYDLRKDIFYITGYNSKFIRFPGGSSNTISRNYCEGIMTQATKRATQEGYIYVDWNVDSNDAGSSANNADEIYENVISGLVHGRDNVVLMHDTNAKKATLEALPRIIDYCQQNGYELKAIDQYTEKIQHKVFN